MDHRAHEEADFINSIGHDVLQYVGGKVSLEMQTPKMLWLKKNLPVAWNSAALLFDLPDFLTWKATESESRYESSMLKFFLLFLVCEKAELNPSFLFQIIVFVSV